MNIGWLGVSLWAATGYGRMSRYIVKSLLERHKVVSIGHEADVIVWGGRKTFKYDDGKTVDTLVMSSPIGDESVQMHAAELVNVYADLYNLDLIIGFWDAFALEFLKYIKIPYAVYVPVDGPVTRRWYNYIKHAFRIITYSKYGYREMLKFAPPSKLAYIPHGIDTNVFRPLSEDKAEIRRTLDATPPVPEDCFLFLHVGANVGDRKKIPLLIYTFKRLAEKYPDVHLYLHTNPTGRGLGRSYDLLAWVDLLGIKDRVHFTSHNPVILGSTDEELCRIYNAADVYVTNSVAEGWGLPILEAQACGLPVICPRNSAQTEQVEGHGWLVENVPIEMYFDVPIYVPYGTYYLVPNQNSMLACMEEAYLNEDLRKEYARKSREFALQYDWSRISPLWLDLIDEMEEELKLFEVCKG